jgi:drug/metabolite transporter (DMT)-like permease
VTADRRGPAAPAERERREGALLVAAAALLWSTGGLAIKWIPLPPLNIVFHRAWIASLTLIILLRPKRIRPTPAFLFACGTYAGMIITFVVATKWTTSANAIFLQDSGIVWVLLFSPLVAGEAIDRRDVAAVVACLGGMALFFVGKISAHGQAGNVLSLVSGAFYAMTVLLLRRLKGPASEWTAIVGNLTAAVAALAFAARPFAVPSTAVAPLVFLGVVQIGVAYTFFVKGLGLIRAAEASIISLLEPIFNPIWVFLGIGERPSVFAICGAAVVLSAIAWRTFVTGSAPADAVPTPD